MDKIVVGLILAAVAAAEPCALCTPDGRMAVLARAGAESFDRLAAPGRTLLRAMALDASGAPLPVVTLTRDGARATVEATQAPGRGFARPIGLEAFRRAET
jgi:hypothetical protein